MRSKLRIILYLSTIFLASMSIIGCAEDEKAEKAEFVVKDLIISPTEAKIGESISVSILVKNIGNFMGTKTVTLSVDNEEVETQHITLGSGEEKTVDFTVIRHIPGIYTIDVEGLTVTGTFLNTEVPLFVYFNTESED